MTTRSARGRILPRCVSSRRGETHPSLRGVVERFMRALSLLTLLSLLATTSVHADEPSELACLSGLSDDEVNLRLAFVERSLSEQRRGAIAWWTTWTTFNTASATFSYVRYARDDQRIRRDAFVGNAIGASLFVLSAAAVPLPGMYAHRRLAKLPATTPEQRRDKLRRGIALLNKSASAERFRSSLLSHLGAVSFALGSTAYVYFRNRDASRRDLWINVGLQLVIKLTVAGDHVVVRASARPARLRELSRGLRLHGIERVRAQPGAAACQSGAARTLALSLCHRARAEWTLLTRTCRES